MANESRELLDDIAIWPDRDHDTHLSGLLREMLDEANAAYEQGSLAEAAETIAMIQIISDRCPTLAAVEEAAGFFRATADRLDTELKRIRDLQQHNKEKGNQNGA